MTEEGQSWFTSLQFYIRERRQERPIPQRDELTPEEEFRCRVLGGSMINWFERQYPECIKSRRFFQRMKRWETDPFIVVTSELPGLVALDLIIPEDDTATLYCLPEEFREWSAKHPDEEFQWHIHYWTYFQPIEPELEARAQAKYPLPAAEKYLQHRDGTLWGEQNGGYVDHLWAWNGSEGRLLEEAFSGGIY